MAIVAIAFCGCQEAKIVAQKQRSDLEATSRATMPAEATSERPATERLAEKTTVNNPEGWCTRCRGDGVIHCRECDDGLRLVCKNCGGTGKVKQIFGSGAAMRAHEMPCTSCYGVDRRVWCAACKGNCGTCGSCNGIGNVLLKQAEEKLNSCKSLSVDFSIQRSGSSDPTSAKGSLFIAERDRILVTRNSGDGNGVGVILVSDGDRFRPAGSNELRPTPQDLGQLSKLVFSRAGFDLTFRWTHFDAPATGWSSKLSDWSSMSNVHIRTAEFISGRQVLPFSYRLHVRNATPDSLDVTVWIDTASRLPRRRMITYPDQTITEEYDRIAIDETLDEKRFRVK
jgi:outer membrane lipoprotein-sorting protein